MAPLDASRPSISGLISGNNQAVNAQGEASVPKYGVQLYSEFINLLKLNGMRYSKSTVKCIF